jgi:hypothetical protein
MVGNTAPVLNDYKVAFARRRWAQAVLGGVNLFINDGASSVPVYVYLIQVVLALVPLIVGLPLVLYFENVGGFKYDWTPAFIFAGIHCSTHSAAQHVPH